MTASRLQYRDRSHRPLEFDQWANLMENRSYAVLNVTNCAAFVVVTQWVGYWGVRGVPMAISRPRMFETLVWPRHPRRGMSLFEWLEGVLPGWVYMTEAEALEGHGQVVGEVSRLLTTMPWKYLRALEAPTHRGVEQFGSSPGS